LLTLLPTSLLLFYTYSIPAREADETVSFFLFQNSEKKCILLAGKTGGTGEGPPPQNRQQGMLPNERSLCNGCKQHQRTTAASADQQQNHLPCGFLGPVVRRLPPH
jgi:hypothetical protein